MALDDVMADGAGADEFTDVLATGETGEGAGVEGDEE